MKIAFDASDLCADQADGTTRYTKELAMRLPELLPKHTWEMMLQCDPPTKTSLADNAKWASSPWPKYWTQLRMPFELFKRKPDALFMPIQQLPLIRPRSMKTVAVIHDLAIHYYPEQFRYKDWLLLNVFGAQAINEADHLIAVSQATADDIAKFYGRTKNVHVVHHGVDHDRFKPNAGSFESLQEEFPNIRKPYILYVGQIQPRKNIIRLIEAFEELKKDDSDLQLVIGGGHGWLQEPILQRAQQSPNAADIIMPGRIPEELLPTLYAHAEVFTLVSLYEGFGIPVIEAMACGTPVVTSNVSSLPEVAGDAAVIVDPLDTHAIAEGIRSARANRDTYIKRGIEQASRFTWENTARETASVLEKALSGQTSKS